MSRHYSLVFASAALGLILAACGGGKSDFKTEMQTACEATEKMTKVMDCACAAEIVDKSLDDKTKSLVLAIAKGRKEGLSQADILKAIGVTQLEGSDMMGGYFRAMKSAAEKCKRT